MENGNGVIKDYPVLKVDSFCLYFDTSKPDEFFKEKARTELRETEETRSEGFKELRQLIQETPELYVPDDEQFLQQFLRPSKWYPKSAFNLLKRYYRFIATHPRVCKDLQPSMEEKAFCSNILLPLPARTTCGCRIVLIFGGTNWKPKEVSLYNLFRIVMMCLGAAVREERTQIAGVHVLFDLAGFSLGHVAALSPSSAAMIAEYVQKCQPSRLKGIHIVNQPFIFNMGFALFKPFILEKTRKRIHFHGTDRASLLNHLSANAVPSYLGGELELPKEPLGAKIWHYFCNFEDEYKTANEYGYKQESKG